ncbi:formyltetrahydrofolate deformylase [Halomonas halocynthiae]|uniref:formyltetrahydrofolate deformylase n=1 Tax=Halomonas halocynthiae TaxID=176290 RepID=UPI0003FC8FDE|nr:formyltetrahydrofolate deformylase [Halomonas halocynthiae]
MGRRADSWILTAQCPSLLGTVDVVTRFLKEQGCYITEQQSFDDIHAGRFFIRTEFIPQQDSQTVGFSSQRAPEERFDAEAFKADFSQRAAGFNMDFELTSPDAKVPVVIMVSKADHCLNDLLYRYRTGQLPIDIRAIVSNHSDLESLAQWHGLPYHHFPITPQTKAEQEGKVWQVIEESGAELVILARYMQVLSSEMCSKLAGRAINIHHSLLPGFKGAKPYHQAFEKGVKLVGATAHYINDDLDEGPIITQGVEPVSHADDPEDLVATGRDIECLTLARAVGLHVERRVFLHQRRTVVFSR